MMCLNGLLLTYGVDLRPNLPTTHKAISSYIKHAWAAHTSVPVKVGQGLLFSWPNHRPLGIVLAATEFSAVVLVCWAANNMMGIMSKRIQNLRNDCVCCGCCPHRTVCCATAGWRWRWVACRQVEVVFHCKSCSVWSQERSTLQHSRGEGGRRGVLPGVSS